MATNKTMPKMGRSGFGFAMARTACLTFLIAPICGWTQPDGKNAAASEAASLGPTKPVMMLGPSVMHEVTFPQVSDRLGLSASQQSLWDVFKNSVNAYSGTYYRQRPILPSPEDAATHQIGRMVDNLQNRLAALEDVETAAKNLYASLTPQQQKTANELLVLTIPTFSSSNGESVHSTEVGRPGKTDSGKRSRRGGSTGPNGGPMMEN